MIEEIKRFIGSKEYKMFVGGKKLTWKQSVRAMCYQCMSGYDNGKEDCMGKSCPLYQYYPYK